MMMPKSDDQLQRLTVWTPKLKIPENDKTCGINYDDVKIFVTSI